MKNKKHKYSRKEDICVSFESNDILLWYQLYLGSLADFTQKFGRVWYQIKYQ